MQYQRALQKRWFADKGYLPRASRRRSSLDSGRISRLSSCRKRRYNGHGWHNKRWT